MQAHLHFARHLCRTVDPDGYAVHDKDQSYNIYAVSYTHLPTGNTSARSSKVDQFTYNTTFL